MSFNLDNYVPVAQRIAAWYEQHPEGRIVADPPELVTVADRLFVASTARAYRTPDDPTPCQGSAWEPYPGGTPFTRDSEMMNAETAAVGRALALAGIEVNRGMASREEVAYRRDEGEPSGTGNAPACSVCGESLAGSKVVKVGSEKMHEGCANA